MRECVSMWGNTPYRTLSCRSQEGKTPDRVSPARICSIHGVLITAPFLHSPFPSFASFHPSFFLSLSHFSNDGHAQTRHSRLQFGLPNSITPSPFWSCLKQTSNPMSRRGSCS